jgi:hypothetical protein
MSDKITRLSELKEHQKLVEDHLVNYTVPQYGDYPEDQMTSASIYDIKMNLLRYVNRIGTNARGQEEAVRDTYKISHYAAILWGKYIRGEENPDKTERLYRWIIYNEVLNLTEPRMFPSRETAEEYKKENNLDNYYIVSKIEL